MVEDFYRREEICRKSNAAAVDAFPSKGGGSGHAMLVDVRPLIDACLGRFLHHGPVREPADFCVNSSAHSLASSVL